MPNGSKGRRRWIAIGGATAVGGWSPPVMAAAVALGAPIGVTVTSPSSAPLVSWNDNAATVAPYEIERATGACLGSSMRPSR